jgi:hypothetical protein
MEYKKEKNQNSSNKININNSQKEEDTSIMSLLWEGIVNIFKSEDNKDQKISQNNNKIKYQYCNCKITHSKEYCDNIYYLMQMLKNDIDPKKSKILYENLLKVHENSLDINGENLRQIKKDLSRTYPSNTIFKDDRILQKLKNVLRAFSNYDNSIKYFQGMNFIVGFFLYHCDEYIAFWLFVALLEEYDLRPIFMTNFPGLKLHVKRVELILQKEYENIWKVFVKFGVKVEIFMVEWVFSLFSSLIPLELQMDFYKGFFSQGWIFFYKMCISSVLNLNGGYFEVDEIYMALKCGKNDDRMKEQEVKDNWKKIIQKAYSLKIKTDVMSINS